MLANCQYCMKQIVFGTGSKCKECKYICHKECEERVEPSCGLPPELLNEFKKKLSCDVQVPSPNPTRASNTKNIINSLTRIRKRSHPQPSINIPFPVKTNLKFYTTCYVIIFSLLIQVQIRQVVIAQHRQVQPFKVYQHLMLVINNNLIFLVGTRVL